LRRLDHQASSAHHLRAKQSRTARVTGGWTIVLGKSVAPLLGVYPTVTLSNARTRREEARALLALGTDPSAAKKAAKRAAKLASDRTFEAVAREWLGNQRNRLAPRYCALLVARLEADVFPQIGSRPIADIEAPELLEMLRKVEKRGATETARRLRQTCGQVFRYALVTGRAKYDPSAAALRGALASPRRPRGHRAMALGEVPNFLNALGGYGGDARTRLALRLMVLTFARTSELRGVRWLEFENLEGNKPLWRIPAERMKMKREHIVPLAPQAVAVLRELRALPGSDSPFLFPSPSREGYMSNNTMLYALYRMGYHGRATVHGFRAMASTALSEMGFRPDVIERQLAHQEQNAVRAAYNRAEYLSERRRMMTSWADYLDALVGRNVVPLVTKTVS
jgi:integrase